MEYVLYEIRTLSKISEGRDDAAKVRVRALLFPLTPPVFDTNSHVKNKLSQSLPRPNVNLSQSQLGLRVDEGCPIGPQIRGIFRDRRGHQLH